MKFLVDSAVSPLLAAYLRKSEHDAVHTIECGLISAGDDAILHHATLEARVVITSDTDFGELLAKSGASVPSIILFRRTSGKPSDEYALLVSVLKNLEVCEALEIGSIVVVDPRRVRIRKLPIGNLDE